MTTNINIAFGFSVMHEAQALKLRFDSEGLDGLISFAKACIWSGITEPSEIIDEAAAITGGHVEEALDTVLTDGENIHWYKSRYGKLSLVHAA